MNIYTGYGDSGTTFIAGKDVLKSDKLIQLVGSLDEFSSWVGLIRANLSRDFEESRQMLTKIQNKVYIISGLISVPSLSSQLAITSEDVIELERSIDTLTECLPPLKNFILPSGHVTACQIFICRTICRRAETFIHEVDLGSNAKVYVNRLSDYLFQLGRYVNFFYNYPEDYCTK